MQSSFNAVRLPGNVVRTGYNPLWMHPSDMQGLNIETGDEVEISSRHGAIRAIVEADGDMRRGTVAMTHGFGPGPSGDCDLRRDGSNINLLLSWTDDPDQYHGMPRMSAVPVAVSRSAEVVAAIIADVDG
jgi:anaerobic selenocysteine-containing dehydrogenase